MYIHGYYISKRFFRGRDKRRMRRRRRKGLTRRQEKGKGGRKIVKRGVSPPPPPPPSAIAPEASFDSLPSFQRPPPPPFLLSTPIRLRKFLGAKRKLRRIWSGVAIIKIPKVMKNEETQHLTPPQKKNKYFFL